MAPQPPSPSTAPQTGPTRRLQRPLYKRLDWIPLVLAVVSAVLAALLGIISNHFVDIGTKSNTDLVAELNRMSAETNAQNQRLKELKRGSEELLAKVNEYTGSKSNLQLAVVQDSVKNIDRRLTALEVALNTDPSKSLAVPLLRRDLDGLQDRYRSDLSSLKDEVARIYTLTQWFIGLMFTIALGVFALALGNLRRPEPRAVPNTQPEKT